MTRTEHLDWCKKRALEYVDMNDLQNAFASIASDLNKFKETENHAGILLGLTLMMTGQLNNKNEMRDFIEGFN